MEKLAGVGDAAVRRATGKGWSEWLAALDEEGVEALEHKDIVAAVRSIQPVSSWWSQMIAVGFEQARGLREPHEQKGGFSVSRTRTIGFAPPRVFGLWNDPILRSGWLPEEIAISKATPGKTVRGTWEEDGSRLDVYLYDAGKERTRVQVQHSRLPSRAEVDRLRELWGHRLEALEETLRAISPGKG